MWKNYFKIAYRNLSRNKVNTFINLVGLTLGIAGALVIYTILKYETGFDKFHSNADKIYRIVHHNKTADGVQYWNTTAYPLADAIREAMPALMVTQTSGPVSATFSSISSDKTISFEEDKVWYVDQSYFDVFDYKKLYANQNIWLYGDPTKAFDHPNSVVLTLEAAKRYAGRETPATLIGQQLLLDDKELMMVSGIIMDPPRNSHLPFEILLSLDFFKSNNQYQAESWEGNHQGTTFIVLPPDEDPTAITAGIAAVKSNHLSKEDNERVSYHLQPLFEIHTETLYGSSPGSYVTSKTIINGLWILAVLLVLIACLNYINLSTAQSLKRAREVGIRKILGSTKKQLFLQHMTEAVIMIFLAFVCAVFIGDGVIAEINKIIDFATFHIVLDLNFYIISIVLIGGITLFAGGYPGIVMVRFSPVLAMKNMTTSKAGLSFRQSMIVFQFAIAQALLAGTVIIASQMNYFHQKDLAYKKDDVLSIGLKDLDPQKREAFRQSLLKIPAVNGVSFSSGSPTTHERQYGTSFRLSHEPLEMRRDTELKFVDEEYFNLFDIPLVAGDMIPFKEEYEINDGVVVNENLVRSLGLTPEDAIGKDLLTNEGMVPIVGVVRDFHNNALHEEIMPCVMVFWGSGFLDEVNISIIGERDNIAGLYNQVHQTWKSIYPDAALASEWVSEKLSRFYKVENYLFKVFQIASGLAILIGCLGLYGLVVLVAQQRTKEIGIRKLTGASVTGIVRLLSWTFLKLVFLAIGLATPLVYWLMDNWLNGFAFRIEMHMGYFIGAGFFTFLIAFLTVGYHASKTALMNPVNALRSD